MEPPAELSAFRAAEKRFMCRDPSRMNAPGLRELWHDLLDVAALAPSARTEQESQEDTFPEHELLALGKGRFTLRSHHPGLVIIPGALGAHEQCDLAVRCLREWPYEPWGVTNLGKLQSQAGVHEDELRRVPAQPQCLPPPDLSWITLGHHFHWTARCYDRAVASPLPEALSHTFANLAPGGMQPQAAIVKVYGERGYMLGHVDDAEPAADVPLLSASLGCAGILLIGSETRNDPPAAILVRSGDLVIFGGRARRCYHSMPRVLPHTAPLHLSGHDGERHLRATLHGDQCAERRCDDDRGEATTTAHADDMVVNDAEREWLWTHRVNISLRQVYPAAVAAANAEIT
mmetsp:Transcript_6988/g.20660  ORF Transcript_6988/g.20660 Transcript_6988/m.20660 type:complete len:346 (+) Transcript_6988:49-1086(+)